MSPSIVKYLLKSIVDEFHRLQAQSFSRHNGLSRQYSPHLFVYDANGGGLIKENGKFVVSVIEQWAKLPSVTHNDITSDSSKPHVLYKQLEKYYAVNVASKK